MKYLLNILDLGKRDELIAMFGQAKLVRKPTGQYHLLGGSQEQRHMAFEWISLFFHEAVVVAESSNGLPIQRNSF